MVSVLHANGLKVQEDLVPNQVLGLSKREAVYVTRVDQNGNLFKNPYTTGLATQIRPTFISLTQKVAAKDRQNMAISKNGTKNILTVPPYKGRVWIA